MKRIVGSSSVKASDVAEKLVQFALDNGFSVSDMKAGFAEFEDHYYFDTEDEVSEDYSDLSSADLIKATVKTGDAAMIKIISEHLSPLLTKRDKKKTHSLGDYFKLIDWLQVEGDDDYYDLFHELAGQAARSNNPKIKKLWKDQI